MENTTQTCPKLEFAVATEVTKLAFECNSSYESNHYSRIFIIPDTKNIWLLRILPNMNEEYDEEEGSFLLERDDIPYWKIENHHCTNANDLIGNFGAIKKLLEDDEFENWDVQQCDSEQEVLETISDGFGIINENGEKIHPEDSNKK